MRARALTLVLTLFAAACAASAGGAAGGGGSNANMLTAATITESAISPGEPFYDTIDRIRPQWLRGSPEPAVFIDGSNAGGIGALRTVNAGSVQEARYYRAEQASGRFGGVYDGGVIEVNLRE